MFGFNRGNKNEREKNRQTEYQLQNLRSHLSIMQTGKRILLHDGRICFFQEYRGGRHTGESFTVSMNGTLEEIPITEYDCLLTRNEDIICPTCGGRHIMDGYLGNPDGTKSRFRENITDNQSYSPPYNIRKVRTHACRDCGYVMVFVKVNKEEMD